MRDTTPKEKQLKEFEVEVKEYVLEPKSESFNYTVPVVQISRASGFVGWFGGKDVSCRNEERTHFYTIQVPREVMKKKLIKKDVEIELPFEVFLAKAKKLILSELRSA